jgi:hypothetical protein
MKFKIEGGGPAEIGAGTCGLNVSNAFERLGEIELVEFWQIQVGLWACNLA